MASLTSSCFSTVSSKCKAVTSPRSVLKRFASGLAEQCQCDALVIGAGIGGASVSYELGQRGLHVICLEQEQYPGYHTTGRAAGLYTENYGTPAVKCLTSASRTWLECPPEDCQTPDFKECPILTPRGLIEVCEPQHESILLRDWCADASGASQAASSREVRVISRSEAFKLVPFLRLHSSDGTSLVADACVYEPNSRDLNVSLVHQCYLRGCHRLAPDASTQGSVAIVCDSRVDSLQKYVSGTWEVVANTGTKNEKIYTSRMVVNAAGAWCDEIAALAGIAKKGIRPLRRAAMIVKPSDSSAEFLGTPGACGGSFYPFVAGVDGSGAEFWYVGQQGQSGLFLASPANRDEDEPCDAQVSDYEVALCADRVETYTTLEIEKIVSKWAGLRCYSTDGNPVYGPDPVDASFIWVAALAGQGVQSCPGYSQLVADLTVGKGVAKHLSDMGFKYEHVSPERAALKPEMTC